LAVVKPAIPPVTVERLPIYRQCLEDLQGAQWISSESLATMAGVNPAQVRKDLSYLGSYGVRGVGYDVEHLRSQIEKELGACPVAIIGAGNLGSALANYPGFAERGFTLAGVFDADPAKVGLAIDGVMVEPVGDLEEAIAARKVAIGIVTTPADAAQEVADRLAAAGVTSILNFAPVVLQVPDGVDVRRVDLSTELQILSFYITQG
jgi:redox-sensing transcriptional repressor